jgi:integral membrane protein (TIGR01906 family)
MTAAHSGTTALEPVTARRSAIVGAAVTGATVVAIVVLAILPLLTPLFLHPALEAAGSARALGLDHPAVTRASDDAVRDLLSLEGTFAFPGPSGGPFLDPSERAHLGDARTLLWLALAAGAASVAVIILALARHHGAERRAVVRAISRGGACAAIGAVVIGVVGVLAFGSLFTLFHQVAFPGGNWTFDPASQRLVQLYPLAFWQLAAAALGLLVVTLGTLTWWAARAVSRRSAGAPDGTDGLVA